MGISKKKDQSPQKKRVQKKRVQKRKALKKKALKKSLKKGVSQKLSKRTHNSNTRYRAFCI
ncbi:hypothetical protein BTM148_12290 [Helicobacter pylori]